MPMKKVAVFTLSLSKAFTHTPSRQRRVKVSMPAFTIVELLVVIIVIGILAAITIVSYTGITTKANTTSLQSDLDNASRLLKLYDVEYGSYPTALYANNCPSTPTADSRYCLRPSSGNTLVYTTIAGTNFRVTNTNDTISYSITNNTPPTVATTPDGSLLGSPCPSGFIPVPGSGTYSTSDFCVMKYEAKADNNSDGIGDTTQSTGSNTWPANTHPISATRKLVSTAAGYPVANISQTIAITAAANYTTDCPTSCHLITEAEWMTIAQNVLSVPSNWSTGTVGSGYIYSGHNDNVPATALEASNDNNGYYGTEQTSGNQKRTLTLTNGEVIWDMAGNVYDWTAGITTGGQPGITGEVAYAWKQWTAVTAPGSLTVPATPASTGLTGSNTWTSTNGIGWLYSNAGETAARSFRRGGYWNAGGNAGVLRLLLDLSASYTAANISFRVSR